MSGIALVANVLPVEFAFDTVDLMACDIVDGEELGALREPLVPHWSVQRESTKVYFLRLADGADEIPGIGAKPPDGMLSDPGVRSSWCRSGPKTLRR